MYDERLYNLKLTKTAPIINIFKTHNNMTFRAQEGCATLTIFSLSPNPFPLFRYLTWRRIGEPISDRHFLISQHYRETVEMDLNLEVYESGLN